MVDKQIQDLVADTTPASGDTVETQKVGGGAGSSKQVTIDDIITQGAPVATGSVKGVMSATDKALIDSSLFFSKVDATTAPTTTDDSGSSYEVGSVWVDVTNDKAYICLDATVSAAVWTEVTQSGGGSSDHGALTGLADDDHTQYSLLSSGAGAPSSTPTRTGEVYVDTTNDVAYISTGTASSADWKQSSGEAVTGTSAQIIVYDGSGDIQSVTMTGDATISNTGVVTVVDANIDHGGIGGLSDDDHSQYSLLSSGAGAPGSTPTRVGEIYVDTTGDVAYVSTGTASSADWTDVSSTSPLAGTSAEIVVYDGSNVQQSVAMSGDATISNTGVVSVVDANIDHGSIGGLADDDHTQYSLISSGAGAPSSTPSRVGEVYIDTTADNAYLSTGTASSADWTQVNVISSADEILLNNVLSTGIKTGGVVTINADTTKFDVSAGTGVVVDNHTDPANPVITPVSWSATTLNPHLAEEFTAIGINSSGTIVTQDSEFTSEQYRDIITIGVIFHSGGLVSSAIENVASAKHLVLNVALGLDDLAHALGDINISGNVLTPNGVNLKLDRSAGVIFSMNGNVETSVKDPNYLSIASSTATVISTVYQDGAGGFTGNPPSSDIDPNFYDDGSGTLAAMPTDKWQAKQLYLFSNGTLFSQYGQTIYNNAAAAIAAADGEVLAISPLLRDAVILGHLIVQEGATDLSNEAEASLHALGNTNTVLQEYAPLGDGFTLDDIQVPITSNGTIITASVARQGGGNFECVIDARKFLFTADSITLTGGTDALPQLNYIYLVETAGVMVLTTNTSGWPTVDDFVAIATVFVQTAATVLTDGSLKVHKWADQFADGIPNGHLAHLNAWIRQQNATWADGVSGGVTIDSGPNPDTVLFSNTAGNVFQMHEHVFPARDMATGDEIYVANGDGTTITDYQQFTDLNGILTDTNNASLSGKYYNLVFWGVVSELEADCKIFVNLPTGSYSSSTSALADAAKTSVYTFPAEFKGTAFLIGRQTLRHQTSASGTWTDVGYESLLGTLPNNIAGSGQAGVTDHGGLSGLLDDDHTQYSLISSGAGAPSSTPTRVGEIYIDITGDIAYNSTGTASSADWKAATNITSAGFQYAGTEEKTAIYTILTTDQGKLFTGDGTFTFTLPASLPVANRDFVDILNIGTGVITVSAGVDGINQASNDTMELGPGESSRFTYTGVTDPIWRASNDTVSLVSSGAGAPGTTPLFVGEVYIDTTADVAYISVGTASSADWRETTIVSSGSGAPATTPLFVGEIYVDTTADVAYISIGTASSADWDRVSDLPGTSAEIVVYDGSNDAQSVTMSGDVSIDNTGATTVDGTVVNKVFTSYTALKAADVTDMDNGDVVYVSARATIGDGGEGHWRVTTSSPGTANDGTILDSDTGGTYFERLFDGEANARWFGADNTGVSNSNSAIVAALTAHDDVILTAGTYSNTGIITLAAGKTLRGTSRYNTILNLEDATSRIDVTGNKTVIRSMDIEGQFNADYCIKVANTINKTDVIDCEVFGANISNIDIGYACSDWHLINVNSKQAGDRDVNGLPVASDERVITDITQANPAVVTSASHSFENGEVVYLADIVGMTELNGLSFTVANKTTNTFELSGEDSTSHTPYVSGGTATLNAYEGAASLSARGPGWATNCNFGGSTGPCARVVEDSSTTEETRITFTATRFNFGYGGLLIVDGSADINNVSVVASGCYFENASISETGATAINSSLDEGIKVVGPAELHITSAKKMHTRNTIYWITSVDGAKVVVDTIISPDALSAADTNIWFHTDVENTSTPGEILFELPSARDSQITNDDWEGISAAYPYENFLTIRPKNFKHVKRLVDGTSTAGTSATRATVTVNTIASDYLTGGASLKIEGTGSAGAVDFRFDDWTPDVRLNGQYVMFVAAAKAEQVGGSYNLTPLFRLRAATGAYLDPDSQITRADIPGGAGQQTDWQYYMTCAYIDDDTQTIDVQFQIESGAGTDDILYLDHIDVYIIEPSQLTDIGNVPTYDSDGVLLGSPTIKDYAVESAAAADGATVTLDLEDGNDQTLTLTQNITLAFSNWPPTGTLGKVTFQCTQDSDTAKTVTVTNVDKWPEGTAWVMSTGLSAIDEVVFWSRDAGTTVYGAVLGQAFA